MLRVYSVVLETVEALQPVLRHVERRDRDLGRQMRRASCSVALNMAEGMYSRGQHRQSRYHTALGSARETLSCLELSQRCGFITPHALLHAQLNQIIGTLVRLVS